MPNKKSTNSKKKSTSKSSVTKKVVNTKEVANKDNDKKKKIIAIIIAIIIIIILLLSLTCCQKKTDLGKLQGKVKQEEKKKKKDKVEKKEKNKSIKKNNIQNNSFSDNLLEELSYIVPSENISKEDTDEIVEEDNKAPVARVIYSNEDLTNEDVEITIIVSEKVKEVDGWTLSENGKALTRIVSENEEDTITITDLAGNTTEVDYSVQNIDKIAPEITGVENMTDYQITVTPVATDDNLDTVKLNGEDFVSGTEIKKNGEYELVAEDKAGNKTIVNFIISKPLPVIIVNESSKEISYASEYEVVNGIANNDVVIPSITYNGISTNKVDTETPGEYVLTYEYTDSDGNEAKPVIITITVKEIVLPEKIEVIDESGIDLTANDVELYVGENKQLNIKVLPEDAINKSVSYSSSDEEVAWVDESGLIKAIKEGVATITITSMEDANVSATIKVIVSNVLATNVSVNINNAELIVGNTTSATANITPDNATVKDVVWTSSDENVATVDQNGNVTAVGIGSANIIATTTDGTNLSNFVSINVTVPVLDENELASAIHTNRTKDTWDEKEDTVTFGTENIKIKKIGYVTLMLNTTTLNKSDFVSNNTYKTTYRTGLISRTIYWSDNQDIQLKFNNKRNLTIDADNYYYIYIEGVREINGVEYGDTVSYLKYGSISL